MEPTVGSQPIEPNTAALQFSWGKSAGHLQKMAIEKLFYFLITVTLLPGFPLFLLHKMFSMGSGKVVALPLLLSIERTDVRDPPRSVLVA